MANLDDCKSALIAQLAAHRAEFSDSAHGVRASLDVGARVKSGFAANPVAWLAGAGMAGLALTRFRSRKTPRSKPAEPAKMAVAAGFALPLAKLLFTIARPTLISLFTARLADYASRRPAPKRGAR